MALTPEKRVDRNGRVVTKHVRAAAERSSQVLIPAPATASATKPKRLPAARTKPVVWDVNKLKCSASMRLMEASKAYAPDGNFHFEASDEEAYAVISTVSPQNLIPLLASGARTREQARSFLRQHELEYLIEDNSALADSALSRNIPARNLLAMAEQFPAATMDMSTYFDAMEITGAKAYQSLNSYHGIAQLVLEGKINIDDLRTVGARRIKAGGSSDAIVNQLEKIAAGASRMTAEELAQIIEKAASDPSTTHPAMINDAVWLADTHGAELTLRLEHPVLAAQLDNTLGNMVMDASKIEPLIIWHDELRTGTSLGYIPADDLIELFDAGISPKDASEGLKDKTPVHQIIGVHQLGIKKAVSSGWL